MTGSINKMPIEVSSIYDPLYNEVTWVHAKWQVYRDLFGKDEKTVDLLNRSAGAFFGVCQEVLLHDVMLGICRLLDPEETGRNENLTLERLVNSVSPNAFGTLRSELDDVLKIAMDSAAFARAHRNRKLAHNDLKTIREIHAEPLPGVSRAAVEKTLEAIRDVMNKVSVHFLETTVLYQDFIFDPGDAQSLIRCLENAEVYRQEKNRRAMLP